jgi:hypothetical protein
VSEKRKSEKNEKKVNKGREKCVRVGEKKRIKKKVCMEKKVKG